MKITLSPVAVYALRILAFGAGVTLFVNGGRPITFGDLALLALSLVIGAVVFSADRKWRRDHLPRTEVRPRFPIAALWSAFLVCLGLNTALEWANLLPGRSFFPVLLGYALFCGSTLGLRSREGVALSLWSPARK